MPIVVGASSYGGVPFDALDDGFSEKRLSTTVREISCDVLLEGSASWDSLGALQTDISKERVPDGDYVIDVLAGHGQETLTLDQRGSWLGYLTGASLSFIHANSNTYRAKCEWTTTVG
jgi:hypothetical protein